MFIVGLDVTNHLTKFEDIPEISLAIRDNNIKRVTNKKSLGFIIDDPGHFLRIRQWGGHLQKGTILYRVWRND